MENVSRTVELNRVCEILTLGATLANVERATAHTEATATETAHAHTTVCSHIAATVEHRIATEEVREACIVSIAIDETKIVGEELSTIWADLRNNEVNLNELFSTELSIVNGCLSIAIAPRVATV
jgi:hypothetical protein